MSENDYNLAVSTYVEAEEDVYKRQTVLLVEQNAKKALSIADRAYVLETGTISLEGKADELMNDESVKKAYLGAVSYTHLDVYKRQPSGSAAGCTEYDNAFRLCFTDPLQGVTLADYVTDTLGLTKVAIIYNNADEYSTGITDCLLYTS